jgi:small acid-soluble spore protein H (minor)
MDRDRVSEIVSSPDMVHVTYDGRPVYIEDLNSNRETASIHFLDQPSFSQEVRLTQLVEMK